MHSLLFPAASSVNNGWDINQICRPLNASLLAIPALKIFLLLQAQSQEHNCQTNRYIFTISGSAPQEI